MSVPMTFSGDVRGQISLADLYNYSPMIWPTFIQAVIHNGKQVNILLNLPQDIGFHIAVAFLTDYGTVN